MNPLLVKRALVTLGCCVALGQEAVLWAAEKSASIVPGLAWTGTYNREVDFARSLLEQTNRVFDEKVWRSVTTDVAKPMVVSYELVSVIFSYPTGSSYAPSATEMVQPDELVMAKGCVVRRATTNEIPANYVRVLDAQRKNVGAEVNVLLRVAPAEKPDQVTCLRRAFRYVYRNGWEEE
jgi:hypothetical protein